jgi:hypothetical protein
MRKVLPLLVICLLAAAGAGCGGDDEEAASPPPTTGRAAPPPPPPPPATSPQAAPPPTVGAAAGETVISFKGQRLDDAIDFIWNQARNRGIARVSPQTSDDTTRWVRVTDIYIGGRNPITEYRIVIGPGEPPPAR